VTAADAPLARTQGFTRRFGRSVAVDDVDLELYPGEVVGLLGANGAGKTTLIRMLLGLLRPTAGELALFGDAPSRTTRRRLGYVPQSLGLYDDLTPSENLAFARAAFGGAGHDGDAGGRALVAGLGEGADVVVGRLSLGLQRRVAFAEALDHRPDLLVLDEPTSGVAPLARARLWDTIHEVADGGAGVLVTTHHMDEAAECDRLVIMAGGRVVAAGTAAEIVGDTTVVLIDSHAWAEAFAAIERAGLPGALVGRSLRIPGVHRADVEQALADLPAKVTEAPATLEERFFQLASSARDSGHPGDGGAGA
jgi:ABC-type multidrug transport system ATPase subunit